MNIKFKYKEIEINFDEPLGKGGFAEVYKGKEKNTGKVYAIKRFSKENLFEEELENMKIMNKCKNSVEYFGYFEHKNYIYIIIELCDCSLEQVIKNKKLNVKEIKEILEQLNNIFKIMYNNSIIHRDIKPENILIKKLENNKYLYKLTDYGFSKQLTQSHNAPTHVGTNYYIAPEIKNNLNIDKSKVDLWSIGILIHKLYFGNTPKNNIIQKTNNIYLDDLIKKLLIEKPFDENKNNCRISWEDYFNHNFFQNNYKKEIENLKKENESLKSENEKLKKEKESFENRNNLLEKENKETKN